VYEWRGQKIRYQVAEPVKNSPISATSQSAPTVILVHGLFVNSDHWRKTLKGLSEGGYRTFAIDLLGCGYSSKPSASSVSAKSINGENLRFFDQEIGEETQPSKNSKFQRYHSILRNVTLGTPQGRLYNQFSKHM
jgi:pimeloyl-ACP methyl ester carboxylesterase